MRGPILARNTQRSPQWLVLGFVLGSLYATAIVLSLAGKAHGDEVYHYAQIQQFLHGHLDGADTHLSTIPGYHAVMAALLWLTGLDSLWSARAINSAFGLLAIGGFYCLRRGLWPGTENLATAQFVVLPIVVPFFFLVYTDVFALALVLWAGVAAFGGRYWTSSAIMLLDMVVRQNDVVWVGLLALLCALPILRQAGLEAWRDIVRRVFPFVFPVGVFFAYWIGHGALTWSRAEATLHPELSLRVGSPAFALLIAGALLPAQTIAGCRRFIAFMRGHAWAIAMPVLLFAVYWWGFHADNPYNMGLLDFLPRNYLLQKIDGDLVWRAVAGGVMVLAACGLAFTRLRPADAVWLYAFAAFFLASSWLIEQRYMLAPFVFWLAFREHVSRRAEFATLALWLVIAVFLFVGVVGNHFFV